MTKEKKLGEDLFASLVDAPYPQNILDVVLNTGDFPDPKRKCLLCGKSNATFRLPEQNRKNRICLSFSMCSDSCMKKLIVISKTHIPSLSLVTLRALMRDVFRKKELDFPAPALYDLVH